MTAPTASTLRQADRRCWYPLGEDGPVDYADTVPHFDAKASVYRLVSDGLRSAREWGDDETEWLTQIRPALEDEPCWLFPECAVCHTNAARDADLYTHVGTRDEAVELARDLDLVEHADGAWTCDGACEVTYARRLSDAQGSPT